MGNKPITPEDVERVKSSENEKPKPPDYPFVAPAQSLTPEDIQILSNEVGLSRDDILKIRERFDELDTSRVGYLSLDKLQQHPVFGAHFQSEPFLPLILRQICKVSNQAAFEAAVELAQTQGGVPPQPLPHDHPDWSRISFRAFLDLCVLFQMKDLHTSKLQFLFDCLDSSGGGVLERAMLEFIAENLAKDMDTVSKRKLLEELKQIPCVKEQGSLDANTFSSLALESPQVSDLLAQKLVPHISSPQ
eukprot:TRINITY_DN16909_c0_g1_i4.p1 TRINITY_DN16909_c0_g1~~TRINITY_DN16909_c0_g1_i4.p1  ORF type:complete len:247 (-),score=40.43 TRINITY_DN16909_c0_g1_i4:105-845(-)